MSAWDGVDRRDAAVVTKDHDLLIEIRTLMTEYSKQFHEHTKLDDAREIEAKANRLLVAEKLASVQLRQERVLIFVGVGMALFQVVMKWWK